MERSQQQNMKKLLACFAVAILGVLTGCVIVSEPEEPPVVLRPGSAEASTFAEIDAAGRLSFDSSRTSALKSIASRTNLSEMAQVHLVDTVFRRIGFESSRMSVLQTLIENEAFAHAAKQRLLANLSKLDFDSDRAAVLRMLDKRGELKA